MTMTANEFKKLLTEIGNLIDARAKTTETFVRGVVAVEVKASEERQNEQFEAFKQELGKELAKKIDALLEKRLEEHLQGVEEHFETQLKELKGELLGEILAARAEAKANDLDMKAKIIRILHKHERWLEEMEKATGVSDPDKN